MLGLKLPPLNASTAVFAVVVVILAIKFQKQIKNAFAAAPLVGAAAVKFMTT